MDVLLREYFIKTLNQEKEQREDQEDTKDIIQFVNKDDVQSNLLSLVQLLGVYLINERQDIRVEAIFLLSSVLQSCEQSNVTEKAVTTLVEFYCSRLTDDASVPNLMMGLDALISRFDHFNPYNATFISLSIFRQVHVQSFPHIARSNIFHVLKNILDKHHDQLNNNNFIDGIINSMTNEKDPRNLMTVYDIILGIVKYLDISDKVEALFDATFCYFPIAFRPPPDNPYGVTSKHLKLKLRKCMASTPLFAPYALLLLQRKLASTSGSAEKDTLETITACVPIYGPDNLVLYGSNLFDSVKMEIINGDPDPGLRDPCLDAIHALATTISVYANDPIKSKKAIQLLKPIVDESIRLLEEFDEDSIKPASLILRAVASASMFTYSLIENVILPILLRQYRKTTEEMEHYLIICTMVALIQARKIVFGTISEDNDDKVVQSNQDSIMFTYKEQLLDIFDSAIKSSNQYPQLHLMGILGLGLFCVLRDYMTDNERRLAVCTLGDVLEREEEENIRMPTLLALSDISISHTNLIVEYTIPLLSSLLPNKMEDEHIPYRLTLEAFERLSTSPSIFFAAQEKLLKKFENTLQYHDKSYSQSIISTLLRIIQTKDVQKHDDIKQYTYSIGFRLIKMVILETISNHSSGTSSSIILSNDILNVICRIILVLFKNLDETEQKEVLTPIYQLFKQKDLSILKITSDSLFCPLLANAPKDQEAATLIFSVFIATLRKKVELETSEELFLNDIIEQALKTGFSLQLESFCRCIASVINKWKDDVALLNYLQNVRERLNEQIEMNSHQALTVYLWITKALIVRSHKQSKELIDKVISLIDHPILGKTAAIGFDILIGDDELGLNKNCFAIVSILHKQKFMSYSLPILLDKFYNTEGRIENKTNFLIAIAYLLKNVPKATLINELPPLVPLLIESISLPEPVLKISTLDLFEFALCELPDTMSIYLVTLLPTLLRLTKKESATMKVRVAALKCLTLIPSRFPNEIVTPLVKETIKQLAFARDDKKRLVRKQAVECLESWYFVASGGVTTKK